MKKREILLVTGVVILLVLGMFLYTYMVRQNLPVDQVQTPVTPPAVPADQSRLVTRVDATHFYIDGVHTIVGEVQMPTPCHLLTYDASVAESMPEQVTFQFDVVNNSEMCAQVVTPQRFMVTASASSVAQLRATFAGHPIELNLTPAAPGERPDDFELYIKG